MLCTPTIRQLLVAGSPQLAALSVGGAVAFPSVLLQQLAGAGRLDTRTASWIGSIHGLASIPSIAMPYLMQWRGRKIAFIVACLVSIIGWIFAFIAEDISTIIISECFHGFGCQSMLAVSLLSLGEMLSPQFRSISVAFLFVLHDLGLALVVILGRFLHWKTVSLVMSMPIIVAMLISFIWPESPSWLAYKGKFVECERSFVWLRGTSDVSNRELQDLITAQRTKIAESKQTQNNSPSPIRVLWNTLRSRDFYLPCIHIFVLLNLVYWSGSLVIIIYSAEMIQRSTDNADIARNGSTIMNSILFVCVTISTVLIKLFPNRMILHVSTICAVVCLLSASAFNYLRYVGVINKENMTGLYLLIALIISLGLGALPVVFSTFADLMPVRHRGIGGAFYVIFTSLLHSSSLKSAPYLFEYMNLWGTLLVYAANASVCGVVVWRFVPETKGRTLQQLEDYYTFGSFEKHHKDDNDMDKQLQCLDD